MIPVRNPFDKLAFWLHCLGALLVVLVALLVGFDGIKRNFGYRPMLGTADIAANAMVILVFLQVPWIIVTRRLLRVTLIVGRLKKRMAAVFEAAAYLVGAAFFGAVVAYSVEPLIVSYERSQYFGSSVFQIPAWPIRLTTIFLWTVCAVASLVVARRIWTEGDTHNTTQSTVASNLEAE